MHDRMDEWLAHLPGEPPAPDLVARIVTALDNRRRTQARWRQIGFMAAVGLAVGGALVVLSWAEATSFLASNLAGPDGSGLSQIIEAFLASPLVSVSGWVQSAISLQSALAEGIAIAFSLGIVLLAVAAFGGLARLLRPSPPANGYSHPMGR